MTNKLGRGWSRAREKLSSRVPENGRARKVLGAKNEEKEGRWQTQASFQGWVVAGVSEKEVDTLLLQSS